MRGKNGHAGRAIGRQRAAAVEAEPADPQHAGACHSHARIVRRQHVAREAGARADHESRDQRADAGGGVDHDAAG